MGDLKDPRLMYLKAVLFLVIGLLGGALLWLEAPNWRTLVGWGLSVWAFARLYYFCFYVIEKYIDPSFRFAGLGSVVVYLLRRRRPPEPKAEE